MNGYTEIRLKLDSGQNIFRRPLVQRLMAEHEALRRENARLRNTTRIDIDGKTYEVERSEIAPAPLDASDDEVLFFEPVPVVILREVE